jgi:DNA-binding transcriptional LysR family regulator
MDSPCALRHIEIFQAIRQTGSVSAAAQLLHVSQPAVTKVLQHAEQQLGFPLFLRVRGKLQATPEALELEREVDKVTKACKACGAWPRACAASRATACGSARPGAGAVAAAAGDSRVDRTLPGHRLRTVQRP